MNNALMLLRSASVCCPMPLPSRAPAHPPCLHLQRVPLLRPHAIVPSRCPPMYRLPMQLRADSNFHASSLLGPEHHNHARLSEPVLQQLLELPMTRGLMDFRDRVDDMSTWKLALQKGVLPNPDQISWPAEPFKTRFLNALRQLEMARFTRRYPAVLDTLLKQMLGMVAEFEEKLLEAEAKRQQQKQQQQQQNRQRPQNSGQQQQQQQQDQQQQEGRNQDDQGEGQEGAGSGDMEMTQEQMEQMLKEAAQSQAGTSGQAGQRQVQLGLEAQEGEAGQRGKQGEEGDEELEKQLAAQLDKAAADLVQEFQSGMEEVMQNLAAAQDAFEDLSDMLEGQEGFSLSRGTWQRSGWRELDDLRRKLERLTELRELVRGLGRAGGKGPLRRAPQQLEASGHPVGVVRSPLQPEEVYGLSRSGDLSRMLPSEMALLAHGWPRKAAPAGPGGPRNSSSSSEGGSSRDGGGGDAYSSVGSLESGDLLEEEYYLPGAHAARMLHRVRRAERALLSYERTGWLDDTPARVTGRMEVRPAAEQGPIILCLDTSGSMSGAREVVAKALALECLRGAHRQKRACYLYAFSGPNEVQELDLSLTIKSLDKLLDFLSCSFNGGTDVDRPLALSLERLAADEWKQADILMVTDGEIPSPSEELLNSLGRATEELGLEVHGLLVSSNVSEPMKKLCTHLHVFKSWSVVGGERWAY